MKSNEIAARLNQLLMQESRKLEDEVPAGFLTIKQLGKHLKRSDRTTREAAAKLTESGGLEKRMFKIRSGKSIIPVAHYRIVG